MYRYLRSKRGFTLVEIMIVVAIIGLLVAIAIPNFIRARRNTRKNLCLNNLRLIQHAKEQYAIEYNAAQTVTPATAMIWGTTTSYIQTTPACPEGAGNYTINAISTNPACPNVGSFAEHAL